MALCIPSDFDVNSNFKNVNIETIRSWYFVGIDLVLNFL